LLTQQNQDLFNLIQQLMANQNIETSAINTRIKRLESITDILQTISTTPAPDYSQEQPEPETTTVNTTATPAQPANPVATNEPEPEPQVMQTEAAEQTLTQLAVNSTTQLLNMIASTTNE
ncbi:MAG TPA: hypothetical protein VK054_09865, partial [Beutenbergiaceae bacterium]|nr:hypothetical protein [Beutenbergiaceae bacterium]